MELSMRIGVAGLGRMGAAMAARLIEVGHEVLVWNRTAERAAPLVAAGARAVATPAELTAASEVVVTMLFDAAAIDAVYRGADGLLSRPGAGKLFIDMSTVSSATATALAAAVDAAGGAFVECPVGGTIGPARTGQLVGFVGGAAADIERARPVLDQLCRRLERVGPVGAGARVKLAINLPLIVFWAAFGEVNALLDGLGCEPGYVVDLFADSAGGINAMKGRRDALKAALAGGDAGPVTFDVDAARKDLQTMIAEAAAEGRTLPVVAQTLTVLDRMHQQGWGRRDCAYIPTFWREAERTPTRLAE
jgi:3-hydroxyisobutyrate dehydrogenase